MRLTLSLSTKGLILVAIPTIFQITFLAFVVVLQRKNAELREGSFHSKEIRKQVHTILQNLTDAETGIRGYGLTDKGKFTEPYDRAVVDIPEELQTLQRLTQGDARQQAFAQRIETKAQDVLKWLTKTKQLLDDKKKIEAVDRESSGAGKRLMDDLRDEIKAVIAEEETLDLARKQDLQRSDDWLTWIMLVGVVVTLATTGLVSLLFRRQISQRFALLTTKTVRLAAGKEPGQRIGGTDEIAQLDRVFHDMAAALADAAQQKRAYTTTLERSVAERTAELTATNRDLVQQVRENETFVYSVSHDLRSPLVNLQGFSKELSLSAADLRALLTDNDVPAHVRQCGLALVDGDIAEAVRFIQTAVMRLSNIIDALLRLSRAGRVEYQWQLVDAHALVGRIVESMKATAAKRGASVTVHLLPLVWGDPTALEQVFANLIGNALNYLDAQRPGRIEVGGADGADDLTTYYVRDNGLGIPAAYLPKVFQAFQRLHPEVAVGEGMGLAIVRRVVERHQGKIWVESTVGVGSTFFVALPKQPAKTRNDAVTAMAT